MLSHDFMHSSVPKIHVETQRGPKIPEAGHANIHAAPNTPQPVLQIVLLVMYPDGSVKLMGLLVV